MSDNKKNVDLNKVSYNFGTKGWTVIGFEIVMLFFMTGITVAVLRSMTSGYTVPYMVFAVIAVIGGILIVAVKEKKAIQ